MTPNVKDFPGLIRWLAETYHRGKYLPIAKRTGLSSAVIDQWKHGIIKSPTIRTLTPLCREYRLDMAKVMQIISRQVAVILVLLATTGMVPVRGGTLQLGEIKQNSFLSEARRRRWCRGFPDLNSCRA